MSDYYRHDHECCGVTDSYCSHFHRIINVKPCDPIFLGRYYDHVHYYHGKTSKDDKHRHEVYYYTSPAIPAASGNGHYHYYYGLTTHNYGHIHYFRGITDIYNHD